MDMVLTSRILSGNGVCNCLVISKLQQQVYTSIFCFHILSHSVPQYGMTALMLASDSGHTDVVQLLLSSGAQVDLQDKVRHIVST